MRCPDAKDADRCRNERGIAEVVVANHTCPGLRPRILLSGARCIEANVRRRGYDVGQEIMHAHALGLRLDAEKTTGRPLPHARWASVEVREILFLDPV